LFTSVWDLQPPQVVILQLSVAEVDFWEKDAKDARKIHSPIIPRISMLLFQLAAVLVSPARM